MKTTAMFGHPVAENPIDQMFNAVYDHYGLNWQFKKFDIKSSHELTSAIAEAKTMDFSGFTITVPYKIDVIPLLDRMDEDVKIIGAANYVTINNGLITGHNNDGKGVVKAINKVTTLSGKNVLMLGAGGAGRAMAFEIARAEISHLTIATRRKSQGIEVAERVQRYTGIPTKWVLWDGNITVPQGTEIILNATHLGALPKYEEIPIDWSTVAANATVVDVITNPRITPFLEKARKQGCLVVDGVEMLVQLAMQIFEAWTGIQPEESVFQTAVKNALREA